MFAAASLGETHTDVQIVRSAGTRMLAVGASVPGFDGPVAERDGVSVRLVPLSRRAARRVRELVPWAGPTPFGRSGSSFGFGDRLGLATRGHIMALRRGRNTLRPVLAQQSARELERTGRTFDDVLDAVTWAVLDAGWRGGFGADADHLKTSVHVARALDAGFTMLTLDPSEHVDAAAAQRSGAELERRLHDLPWRELEDDWAALRRRHAALVTDDDTLALARAAATYGAALAHVAALVRGIPRESVGALDVEISLDETALPMSVLDHAFVVMELRRLGVQFSGIAVRFAGTWEKGVDIRGDLDDVRRSIATHAALAERLGPYRLSVHSGSDKPSLYPMLAAAGGSWHVKTSGTSYLEALRVVARRDPQVFRRVLAVSSANLDRDRLTYAISPAATLPEPSEVRDVELPSLLDRAGPRQCLHVTYGAVLGDREVGPLLRSGLERLDPEYAAALETHFARHVDPLAALP